MELDRRLLAAAGAMLAAAVIIATSATGPTGVYDTATAGVTSTSLDDEALVYRACVSRQADTSRPLDSETRNFLRICRKAFAPAATPPTPSPIADPEPVAEPDHVTIAQPQPDAEPHTTAGRAWLPRLARLPGRTLHRLPAHRGHLRPADRMPEATHHRQRHV